MEAKCVFVTRLPPLSVPSPTSPALPDTQAPGLHCDCPVFLCRALLKLVFPGHTLKLPKSHLLTIVTTLYSITYQLIFILLCFGFVLGLFCWVEDNNLKIHF